MGELADEGAIGELTFLDAEHYELESTSGNDDVNEQLGTYVLDKAAGTLTLTDDATGESQVLPFQTLTTSDSLTTNDDELRLVGGATLGQGSGNSVLGSQSALSPSSQGAAICSASVNGQTFASASPTCATHPPSGGTTLSSAPADGGVALGGGCPTAGPYPSGISLKQVADAKTTAAYVTRLGKTAPYSSTLLHTLASQGIETCFIDMSNLQDSNGNSIPSSTLLSAHYSIQQLAWGQTGGDNFVKIDPAAPASLEAFATATGKSLTIYSAYRGPARQESTCESVCGFRGKGGSTSCAACGLKSQHMFGDAYDLTDLTLLSAANQTLACSAGFRFVYNEHNHLHVDTIWRSGSSNYCWKLNPKAQL